MPGTAVGSRCGWGEGGSQPDVTRCTLLRPPQALGLLFDAPYSAVQLSDIRATGPRTIEADWKLGGCLKFAWHPMIQPVAGAWGWLLAA